MPAGSIDFAKFESAVAKGDADAAAKALVDTAPPPAPAKSADKAG
jgi:hypothetical protein